MQVTKDNFVLIVSGKIKTISELSKEIKILTAAAYRIVRIIIDQIIIASENEKYDYICNHLPRNVPIGCEIRAYKRNSLDDVHNKNLSFYHKSNITSIFYENPKEYSIFNIVTDKKYFSPDLRLTVDEPKDYFLASILYDKFYINKKYFSLKDIIEYLKNNKELTNINARVNQKSIKEG